MDPLERAPDTERPPALTRREVLRHGAVLGAAVWAAPAIARLPAAAGAAGSPPVDCGTGEVSGSGGVLENPYLVTSPGPGTFAVPAGVTTITVEVWGAGGDGSPTPGQGGQGSGGGGGGGWAASHIVGLTDCESFSYEVGRGGSGDLGGATWFGTSTDARLLEATGGQNGVGREGGAGGSGRVGSSSAFGGAGGSGGGNGGGGGGASGGPPGSGAPGSDGGDGAGNVGGTGGIALEGQGGGGNGGDRDQFGSNGDGPGGGGGGTGRNGSPAGLGAHGQLRITWSS